MKQYEEVNGKRVLTQQPTYVQHFNPRITEKRQVPRVTHVMLDDGTERFICDDDDKVFETANSASAHRMYHVRRDNLEARRANLTKQIDNLANTEAQKNADVNVNASAERKRRPLRENATIRVLPYVRTFIIDKAKAYAPNPINYSEITRELNKLKMPAARGGLWTNAMVHSILRRAGLTPQLVHAYRKAQTTVINNPVNVDDPQSNLAYTEYIARIRDLYPKEVYDLYDTDVELRKLVDAFTSALSDLVDDMNAFTKASTKLHAYLAQRMIPSDYKDVLERALRYDELSKIIRNS